MLALGKIRLNKFFYISSVIIFEKFYFDKLYFYIDY